MKHYWSKSFEDYKSKLGKWQNAHWFRTELREIEKGEEKKEEERFGERIEGEGFHTKYDSDMIQFVQRLTRARECVGEIRKD